MLLVYDVFFSPVTTFHLELHWLVASGSSVDDWIQFMYKKAQRNGLNLCQVPVNQPLKTSDPFHLVQTIPLSSKSSLRMVQQALVERFGFVLDGLSHLWRVQYIHLEGIVAIRVQSSSLLWIENQLRWTVGRREALRELFRRVRAYFEAVSAADSALRAIVHRVVNSSSR